MNQWSNEAVELINSFERYTVLKAIEQGKILVKKVMDEANKNEKIDKKVLQLAIEKLTKEIEDSKNS